MFYELEEEPDLFGSASNLAALVTGSANASADTVAGSNPSPGVTAEQQAQQQAAGQQVAAAEREERVVLLRNPPRRFVRPVRRTQKLLGMVQVLCASSELVHSRALHAWLQGGGLCLVGRSPAMRVHAAAAAPGPEACLHRPSWLACPPMAVGLTAVFYGLVGMFG